MPDALVESSHGDHLDQKSPRHRRRTSPRLRFFRVLRFQGPAWKLYVCNFARDVLLDHREIELISVYLSAFAVMPEES